MVRRKAAVLALGAMVALVVLTAVYAGDGGAKHASAVMKNAAGDAIGSAHFVEDSNGIVHVSVHVRGMTAGAHGIHIHTTGKCSPTFADAGLHFNPALKEHGLANANGPHAGDLPVLRANGAGLGHLNTKVNRVTLSAGATSVFDADGSALVIHANPDDQVTDPTGNSGGRVACGVIVAG